MRETFCFLLVLFSFGSSRDSCPEFIICETSEKHNSCPRGQIYRANVKVHGCCPGCVPSPAGGEEGNSCDTPVDCQPGLTCKNQKCVEDPLQSCEHYKRFDKIFKKTQYWKPVCFPDGTYAPKQCKGEKMSGKCFCVNKKGERIFGEEEWSKAENMTCGCSRAAEDARSRGWEPALHCDRLGNYEPLQCDRKVCWCANPISGIPYTATVPLEMMISLPCYDREAVGAQYYRQCDSTAHVRELTKSLLRNHGTTGILLASERCNFDGSYHRVQIFRNKIRCVQVNNAPLTVAVESTESNCNCAYDRDVAQSNQIEFSSECLPNGNYKRRQVYNGRVYCVDGDGFHYSNDPEDCPDQI